MRRRSSAFTSFSFACNRLRTVCRNTVKRPDVPAPAHWARRSGSVSGLRFAVAGSLWSNLFPPSPPPPVFRSCSRISQVLQVCPTSHVRFIVGVRLWTSRRTPVLVPPGEHGISRFPCEVLPYVHGVFDREGPHHTSRYRCAGWCLPLLLTASASPS